MLRIAVFLGYTAAYNYEKQLDEWKRFEAHERKHYGYDRAESDDVKIVYAALSKREKLLLPSFYLKAIYLYLIKLPILLLRNDAIWTHLDKDGLFVAFLRRLPFLNRKSAVQISNFIWLLDNSKQYSKLKKRVITWLLGIIDRVVFWSPAEKEKFIEIFGCDINKLRFIPFGINLNAYSADLPHKAPVAAEKSAPGFILGIGTDKHRDIDMFRKLACEMPKDGFILATANKNFLNGQYEKNITVLKGSLPEIRWLYINCTCVIIPLKYNVHVSGCTTVLEAAAMRKPVVISDVPGIRDYVIDGVTGIIVPVGDAQAFRNAVLKLMNDKEYSRTLGENAYSFVKDRFTSDNFAKAHLELTYEILNGRCKT